MRFHIITLFPNAFDSYLSESILKRAISEQKISVTFYNPRDFVQIGRAKKLKISDPGYFRETRIDDRPYGGGPGMVVTAEPVIRAIAAAMKPASAKATASRSKIIWLSPGGKQFDTTYAKKVAQKFTDIIIICGRYEGIDARIKKIFKCDQISIGPFVLTGGELPAEIIIDCIARQVPGVLGNFDSREEEREGHETASSDVYTRPEVLTYQGKKYRVPRVLLSGNHTQIAEWKRKH